MISQDLIKEAMKYYNEFKDKKFVVNPSLPILYFGDIKAYCKSEIKIITVGINPSDREFKKFKSDKYSFEHRFPDWKGDNLPQVLNDYFKKCPYEWFENYELILNGTYCSYKDEKYENRAIHTDMCSPLATYPTWSGLKKERPSLFKDGFTLWKLLLDELKPHIILVSMPCALFELFPKVVTSKRELLQFSEDRNGNPRKPYKVYEYEYDKKLNKTKTRVIYGRMIQKPFDAISNKQKKEIGLELTKT